MTIRHWHWISGAICLVGMLFFAITGITLNHAADIGSQARTQSFELEVPTELLSNCCEESQVWHSLPAALRQWLAQNELKFPAAAKPEWDGTEIYAFHKSPGADRWIAIEPTSGELYGESTNRGAIAYFNDLHKGRDSGPYWKIFLDLFSVGAIVFCLSGLWLLAVQAKFRKSTWPYTALGIVIPIVLMIFLIH